MNSRNTVLARTPTDPFNPDKDFVLKCCADLAEAGYGLLQQSHGSAQHLCLVSGEIYRVEASGLTRIR
jgi:hypothetical protein